LALLREAGHDLVLSQADKPLSEDEMAALIPGAAALIAGNDAVTAKVIEAGLPDLKIIARNGVGYNNIDVAAARDHGIAVTVTPGGNSVSVAELAWGLMLALARRIPWLDRSVRAGSWARATGCELAGKTLGIIGLGAIGREVAKRAAAFDMTVAAYDVKPDEEFAHRYGIKYLPLPDLLAQADFVSLHAPALPSTRGLINRGTLALMKPTAFLINTARGDLVVEDDLYQALAEKRIAGAGLDAFSEEPFRDSRFFGLENVILTPHAGAHTKEAVDKVSIMAAEEVIRVLADQPPRYPVRELSS